MSEEATEIPVIELDEAVKQLRGHPAYNALVEYIEAERDDMIGRFASVVNDGEAMKTAGAVAAIDRILSTFRG